MIATVLIGVWLLSVAVLFAFIGGAAIGREIDESNECTNGV